MLAQQLEKLRSNVVEYGNFVSEIIEHSIKGIVEKDRTLLRKTIDELEPRANEWELTLEQEATALIARFEPKARHLRTILSILKINNDLERAADCAVNIAESGLYILRYQQESGIDLPVDPGLMGRYAVTLLREAIMTFLSGDAAGAQLVCEKDNVVDGMHFNNVRDLVGEMMKDSAHIDLYLNLQRVSHNLERVADLSTNIAEDVIFVEEGRVIKHQHPDS